MYKNVIWLLDKDINRYKYVILVKTVSHKIFNLMLHYFRNKGFLWIKSEIIFDDAESKKIT